MFRVLGQHSVELRECEAGETAGHNLEFAMGEALLSSTVYGEMSHACF